jgi:hypothetical protein
MFAALLSSSADLDTYCMRPPLMNDPNNMNGMQAMLTNAMYHEYTNPTIMDTMREHRASIWQERPSALMPLIA